MSSYWDSWVNPSSASGSLLCGSVIFTLHRWHDAVSKPGKWMFTYGMGEHDPRWLVGGVQYGVIDDYGNLVLTN